MSSAARSRRWRLVVVVAAALELEARQLALVKRGERLFIVKGIAAWQRRHGGSIRHGG